MNLDDMTGLMNGMVGPLGDGVRVLTRHGKYTRIGAELWYAVIPRLDVKEHEDAVVLISTLGNGSTPEAAVAALFEKLTACTGLDQGIIVLNAGTEDRRHFVWTGYAFAPYPVND